MNTRTSSPCAVHLDPDAVELRVDDHRTRPEARPRTVDVRRRLRQHRPHGPPDDEREGRERSRPGRVTSARRRRPARCRPRASRRAARPPAGTPAASATASRSSASSDPCRSSPVTRPPRSRCSSAVAAPNSSAASAFRLITEPGPSSRDIALERPRRRPATVSEAVRRRRRQRRQRAPAQPGPPLAQLTAEVPRDDPDVLGRRPAQQVDQERPLGQPRPRRGEGGRRRRQVGEQHPCILPPGTDIPRAGATSRSRRPRTASGRPRARSGWSRAAGRADRSPCRRRAGSARRTRRCRRRPTARRRPCATTSSRCQTISSSSSSTSGRVLGCQRGEQVVGGPVAKPVYRERIRASAVGARAAVGEVAAAALDVRLARAARAAVVVLAPSVPPARRSSGRVAHSSRQRRERRLTFERAHVPVRAIVPYGCPCSRSESLVMTAGETWQDVLEDHLGDGRRTP